MKSESFTFKCNKCGSLDIKFYPSPIAMYADDLEVRVACADCDNKDIFDDDFWNDRDNVLEEENNE